LSDEERLHDFNHRRYGQYLIHGITVSQLATASISAAIFIVAKFEKVSDTA
jgi:hypothetical protein